MIKLTRRSILLITVILFFAFSLSAVAEYQQAPELEQMVEEGDLPPVEERLPPEPMVVEPNDSIGEYGGTLRWSSPFNRWRFENRYVSEPLARQMHDTLEPIPNVAKDWTTNEDKSKWTFNIREGIKWSDGEKFTTEDIMFWWEDLIKNEIYPAVVPGHLHHAGEPAEVYAEDDFTLVIEFAEPNPLFEQSLYYPYLTTFPKHYLKQFHPDYGEEDFIEEKINELGVDDWTGVMGQMGDVASQIDNPDLPVISAWKTITDEEATLTEVVRNPYYWKVDPAGNQLPYIDKIAFDREEPDEEVRKLQAMQGDLDLLFTMDPHDFSLFNEAAETGNYRVLEIEVTTGTYPTVFINQTYEEDEEIAQILQNKDFRHGINYAINKEEIIDFLYMGFAEPRQAVVSDDHPAGSRELSSQKIEFDLDKARQHLDEAGLDEKNDDGYRLLPSGEEFNLIMTTRGVEGIEVDSAELISEQLEEVGINALVRPVDVSLWNQQAAAGQMQIAIFRVESANMPLETPLWYYPVSSLSYWAPRYGAYYASDGAEGRPAEGYHEEVLNLYEEAGKEIDSDRRNDLIREAMEIHIDKLWRIGVSSFPSWPQVVSNRVRNFPDNPTEAGGPAQHYTFTEQFWIEN